MIQIGKNYWDLKTYRKSQKSIFATFFHTKPQLTYISSATEVILSKVQLSMFLDVQIHKDWILSVMEVKNSKPFWSLSENGKFRKGNTNDARNYIVDIVSIVGAIVFLLSVN